MHSAETMQNLDNKTNTKSTFLDYALSHDFGDIHFKIDPVTGMIAIIAIHSTRLGPALGGCRFIHYDDPQAAILDAMRLARGMSYKAASVNLPLGGGKSVIIKPRHAYDHEGYFHAFGQFVEELGGRYITALDSGTTLDDMDIIVQHTSYCASLSNHNGDPAPYTARGVFRGIQAAVDYKLGRDSLAGVHVAIQGIGHVGSLLAKHLHEAGARLTIADVNQDALAQVAKEFGATIVASENIHKTPCDVFAPCALGSVINDISIEQIQAPIIAGAANNQLAHSYHGQMLFDKGILYAPDYVLNAGGLIFAASQYLNTPEQEASRQIDGIGSSLTEIFKLADKEKLACSTVADQLAREKLAE